MIVEIRKGDTNMTKLSNAQQKVLDEAKADIDEARQNNYYDWVRIHGYMRWNGKLVSDFTDEEIDAMDADENAKRYNVRDRERYENIKNGIVRCHTSSKTIQKLEKLGLIEIIRDSNGEWYGLDTIKILNY